MKKKITSILLLCSMFLTLTLPVSASQTVSGKMQPGRQECGICGKMTLRTVKLYTHEVGPISTECKHNFLHEDDKVWNTYTTYQYQCSTCSYKSAPWDTLSSTRTE